MGTIEKLVLASFGLVAIYLFIFNASKTSEVIGAGAKGWSQVLTTLQGR